MLCLLFQTAKEAENLLKMQVAFVALESATYPASCCCLLFLNLFRWNEDRDFFPFCSSAFCRQVA